MLLDFNAIWDNIKQCEGQTFATLTGQAFAYDVQEDGLTIRRSDMVLKRGEVESVYRAGTSDKSGSGRGTVAYINALLRDNRIRS